MNIIIDHGGYAVSNMGDLSMLQVAVKRFSEQYPEAKIYVFTTAPEKLKKACPNVEMLSVEARSIWFGPITPKIMNKSNSLIAKRIFSGLEKVLRRYFPYVIKQFIQLKLKLKGESLKLNEFNRFINSFEQSNIVVAAGGGYIADSFKGQAISVLEMLELASQQRKITGMFGQGLGPIEDKILLNRCKDTFSKIKLISLREKRNSPYLLKNLGVCESNITVTGDEAIELAYSKHPQSLGDAIGINLRFSDYSGINSEIVSSVRESIQEFANKNKCILLPVPIDHAHTSGYVESDCSTIKKLLQGYDDLSDGGVSLDTPEKVIDQVSQCRVVITGSYHAGVFALSQGISVISLVSSQYYADKFLGLSDQFENGCKVFFLEGSDLKERLISEISTSWEKADTLRPMLLEAARRQIKLGYEAYQRLNKIVSYK